MNPRHLFVGVAAAAALLGIVSPAEAGVYEGFTYSGGTYTFIIPPGSTVANLNSINDAGAVAGYTVIGGVTEGFTYSGGTY
ncbi:MAG TPA: hypothetical protein VGG92_01175, partial [Caulobacteraceae bacterium]